MKSLGKLKTVYLLILPFLSLLTTKYNPYLFIKEYHLNIEKTRAAETRLLPERIHFLYFDFFLRLASSEWESLCCQQLLWNTIVTYF